MRPCVIAAGALLAAGLSHPGNTHAMPNSTVVVEASAPGRVDLAVTIPISELEAAEPGQVTGDKAKIEGFVREHIGVRGSDQRDWLGTLIMMAREGGDHPLLKLSLRFTPASGGSQTASQLRYDAVTDRIASHYVLVYRREGPQLRALARLQAPDNTVALDGRP